MLHAAIPILPSRDLRQTLDFFTSIGAQYTSIWPDGTYGIMRIDDCEIHFYVSDDTSLIEMSCCRITVSGIDELYAKCLELGIVHPNGPLALKPWGFRDFAVLDPSGVLYTFGERVAG